jgi:general secretion pathway protein A
VYLAHFGLRERPFSNTPDSRFVYLGARHEEALAHLLSGVQDHGGIVQLTGEIGTGKTTMCRLLLSRLPDGVDVALILNPLLTLKMLLASICDELGVKYETHPLSQRALVDALYRHLLAANAAGRRTVLIVDEAQSLGVVALERLRLLTNLETERDKLLQVILIGQPELIELLGRKELLQLSQRITARYHLRPLDEDETHAYVRHRLELAGGSRDVFEVGALRAVHRLSGGVPRLINTICDRALLGAYAQRRDVVDRATVRAAAGEVLPPAALRRRVSRRLVTAAALVLLVVGAGSAWLGGGMARFRPTAAPVRMEEPPIARPAPPVAPAPAVAPAALPATPASPPPALAELLQRGERPADRVSAFASVFSQWRLEPRRLSDPCEAAASFGLGCVEAAGGWPRLRRFDLPAVLRLKAPDGTPRWAALVGLDPETASLDLGGRVTPVALAEIDAVWDGRFEVLWQPPPIGARAVMPGSRGRAVVWLRHRLDALDGQPASGGSDAYDERLRARVVAFQRDQSLAADGVAGIETLVRLASLVDQRIPSLSRTEKQASR